MDEPTYRVSGAGQHVGLDVVVQVAGDDYVSYSKPFFGASVLVHGSQDYPQGADKAIIGQPGSDVTIGVIPSVVVSERAIRTLSLKQRVCYFDDEVIRCKEIRKQFIETIFLSSD